ncbi:MAG: alpha/beta hydrolase, partial [Kiloniellales bacterium]
MGWIATALGLYLLFVAFLFVMQRQMLYLPSGQLPDPAASGVPGLGAVTVPTKDGLQLTHWYRAPAAPDGPVVAVLHGNAGHIGHRIGKYWPLLQAGFGLLLIEYRGYGGNPGSPSETGLTEDARSALAWLMEEDVAPGRIVLYGESLGTAPAVRAAAAQARGSLGPTAVPFAGLVLEAPFTSIADVAQHHYWYVPVRWLLRDPWEVAPDIGAIAAPLLVVHGERDRVVPARFGKRLYELAAEPKEALFPPDGDHNGLLEDPAL